jgi:hypothetical protein
MHDAQTSRPVAVLIIFLLGVPAAMAGCPGGAPLATLQAFEANPSAWYEHTKSAEFEKNIGSLAATAVNYQDQGFGASLGTLLGRLSSDQGRHLGVSLAGLGAICSDPLTPGDPADRAYLANSVAPYLRANDAAFRAFTAAIAASEPGGDEGAGSIPMSLPGTDTSGNH